MSHRTFVNHSVLLELNFQPHELLISANTVCAMKNTHHLVLHFAEQ